MIWQPVLVVLKFVIYLFILLVNLLFAFAATMLMVNKDYHNQVILLQ